MADSFARMRQLIGTTAEWAANDLIIGLGEFALERIGGGAVRMKLGDGVAKFSQLPYFDPGIFDFVLKDGDTMTGPLVLPELTVQGPSTVLAGLTVQGGNSSYGGPVNLGAAATATSPASTSDDSTKVATTHWVQQQVGGIITGLTIKGTWNAATNTPPLASGGAGIPTPARGDFYIVSVSGTTELDGISTWNQGDTVVFNGVSWQRVPQTLGFDQIVAGLGYTPVNKAGDTMTGALNIGVADAARGLLVAGATKGVRVVPSATDTLIEGVDQTGAGAQPLRLGGSVVQAPTPTPATLNNTQVATTAFVQSVGGASLRLFAETTLVASAADMRVNFPAGAKKIEVEYYTVNLASAADTLALRALNGATPVTATTYYIQQVYGNGATVGAAYTPANNSWTIGGGLVSAKGTVRPVVTAAQAYMESTHWFTSATVGYVATLAFWGAAGANMTGLQMFNGAGVQFATGSFLRCYAVF